MWTPPRRDLDCSVPRSASGLVVDDSQAAVVQFVEAVDDAAHGDAVEIGAQVQLEPDRADTVRVLQLQVVVHEHVRVDEEGGRLSLVEPERLELVPFVQLLPGCFQGLVCRFPASRAAGMLGEQQLERPVHEGALQGRRRRRFRQVLDDREPERERAIREGRDLRGRQGAREGSAR